MRDFLRYDHFNQLDAPIVVLTADGTVFYRNAAALSVSRSFRLGAGIAERLSGGAAVLSSCIKTGKPIVEKLTLKNPAAKHTVLLIPDFSPEGDAVILVSAPLLEGTLTFERSAAAFSAEPLVKGVAELPDGKTLSVLGRALVRSFAGMTAHLAAGIAPYDERAREFTVGDACLFLNRLFERFFSCRDRAATAKCTADCVDMPLEHFEELTACLSCLSVILAVNAEDRTIGVICSCSAERASFLFSCLLPRDVNGSAPGDLFPGRRVELAILSAVLNELGWDARASVRNRRLELELVCRKRFPASFFKTPAERNAAAAVRTVMLLLAYYLDD